MIGLPIEARVLIIAYHLILTNFDIASFTLILDIFDIKLNKDISYMLQYMLPKDIIILKNNIL